MPVALAIAMIKIDPTTTRRASETNDEETKGASTLKGNLLEENPPASVMKEEALGRLDDVRRIDVFADRSEALLAELGQVPVDGFLDQNVVRPGDKSLEDRLGGPGLPDARKGDLGSIGGGHTRESLLADAGMGPIGPGKGPSSKMSLYAAGIGDKIPMPNGGSVFVTGTFGSDGLRLTGAGATVDIPGGKGGGIGFIFDGKGGVDLGLGVHNQQTLRDPKSPTDDPKNINNTSSTAPPPTSPRDEPSDVNNFDVKKKPGPKEEGSKDPTGDDLFFGKSDPNPGSGLGDYPNTPVDGTDEPKPSDDPDGDDDDDDAPDGDSGTGVAMSDPDAIDYAAVTVGGGVPAKLQGTVKPMRDDNSGGVDTSAGPKQHGPADPTKVYVNPDAVEGGTAATSPGRPRYYPPTARPINPDHGLIVSGGPPTGSGPGSNPNTGYQEGGRRFVG